jgi:hypothetical protein
MPKYVCLCENIINLSDIPSPNQLLLIEDVDYDKYFDKTDAEKLYEEMVLTVRCNTCKRLYVFENGYNNNPIIYKLEEGIWNKDK